MNAFQPGAFQAAGFQIVATLTQPSGGYGFGAYDRTLHRRKRQDEELAVEIAALEEHIAEVREVPPALVRLESQVRVYAAPLPPPVKRVVRKALKLQTPAAFAHAERVIKALEEEEEDFVAMIVASLH